MMKLIKALFVFTIFICFSSFVNAQVSISPTSLFFDSNQKFATLLVMNGTDKKQEVFLEFPFGYPDAGTDGNLAMVYDNPEMAKNYSIEENVKGFPRNFILEPGQRQTIRLTVRPGSQLKEGVYWTRIKTISNPESPPVGAAAEDKINPQITFKFEQVTTLFYKVGKATTGLNIEDARIDLGENKAALITDVTLVGNSPYLGSMNLEVKDDAGQTVFTDQVFVSIYVDDARRIEFDASDLSSGDYMATLTFKTERADIPQDDIIQAPPVSKQIQFSIP